MKWENWKHTIILRGYTQSWQHSHLVRWQHHGFLNDTLNWPPWVHAWRYQSWLSIERIVWEFYAMTSNCYPGLFIMNHYSMFSCYVSTTVLNWGSALIIPRISNDPHWISMKQKDGSSWVILHWLNIGTWRTGSQDYLPVGCSRSRQWSTLCLRFEVPWDQIAMNEKPQFRQPMGMFPAFIPPGIHRWVLKCCTPKLSTVDHWLLVTVGLSVQPYLMMLVYHCELMVVI